MCWLKQRNGIRIDRYGTVVSSGSFESATSDGPACSLELWLKPRRTWDKGTVLAFYNPKNGRQFSIQQYYTKLVLGRGDRDEYRHVPFDVDEVVRENQAFITVTSDGQATTVYRDGNLIGRSSRFGLTLSDLAGTLIVANSAMQANSWAGELRGLAIYKGRLTTDQVAQHHQDWTQAGKPSIFEDVPALALYLFNEHTGKTIHNQVRSGVDLYIPEQYLVVDQMRLESPWKEFHRKRTHLDDILSNIAGFVPLGFFFCAYFTSVRQVKHGGWAVIVFGAIVSLTIEVLQAYLPTRDSGFTDVVSNTLGTAVGAGLYRIATSPVVRALVPKGWSTHFEVPYRRCVGNKPSQTREGRGRLYG